MAPPLSPAPCWKPWDRLFGTLGILQELCLGCPDLRQIGLQETSSGRKPALGDLFGKKLMEVGRGEGGGTIYWCSCDTELNVEEKLVVVVSSLRVLGPLVLRQDFQGMGTSKSQATHSQFFPF